MIKKIRSWPQWIKTTIAFVIFAGLMIASAMVFRNNMPKPVEGAKTVVIEVTHADESTKEFTLHTDQEFLGGALEEQEGLVAGDEGEFGLFVKTVDGETADDSLQQWWCITKSGAEVNTGVDTTPIADGEKYEFTLKTGW